MSATNDAQDVFVATKLHDEKNLDIIQDAFDNGRIDDATRKYLVNLYSGHRTSLSV